MGGQHLPDRDERAHDEQAHLDRSLRVQHVAEHQRAVFGKSQRQNRRELQPGEVITMRDHLLLLGPRQLEHELGRNPLAVAAHGLV